jgi:hypothetical protein
MLLLRSSFIFFFGAIIIFIIPSNNVIIIIIPPGWKMTFDSDRSNYTGVAIIGEKNQTINFFPKKIGSSAGLKKEKRNEKSRWK